MAYDRYDTRSDRSRWSSDDRHEQRGYDRGERSYRDHDRHGGGGGRDERGFFERAGDEIASWFGDDEAERRREQDQRRDQRDSGFHDRGWERGGEGRGYSASERDYNPSWRREMGGSDRDHRGPGDRWSERGRSSERGYRPMTGDYGRGDHESTQFFAASGVGRGERDYDDYRRHQDDRPRSQWDRDSYRRTSRAGTSDKSDRSRHESSYGGDPHYHSWRSAHMDELDRDYDDYRREHQSKFESDFGSWRERRQQKRGMMGQIREHMEVVGSDGEHVGTVDRAAGDRIILTKSDPDSGGVHHSLSCSDIDKVEDNKVILDCSADDARKRWRDESRSRALFEREDRGADGPRILDRSFEGTYR